MMTQDGYLCTSEVSLLSWKHFIMYLVNTDKILLKFSVFGEDLSLHVMAILWLSVCLLNVDVCVDVLLIHSVTCLKGMHPRNLG